MLRSSREGSGEQEGTKEVKGTTGGKRLGALDRNLGRRRHTFLVLATLAENMPATAS